MELRRKLAKWLDKHYPDKRGEASRLARDIGRDQSNISRWRAQRREDPDALLPFDLDDLEALAAAQDHIAPWKLLREIETEKVERRGGRAVPIDEKWRKQWAELFHGNHRRAEGVLMNLRHQEEIGYTALISRVVRLIIEHGPQEAAGLVAAELGKHEEKRTSQLTKLRRKLTAEYEEIGR